MSLHLTPTIALQSSCVLFTDRALVMCVLSLSLSHTQTHTDTHTHTHTHVCVCVCLYIQGVTGGMDQTSGGCSLC